MKIVRSALVLLLIISSSATFAGALTPTEGLWWNPNESGRGYTIEVKDDTLVMTMFVYDEHGDPTFYQAVGSYEGLNAPITMPAAEFVGGQCLGCNHSRPEPRLFGEVTLTFDSFNTATLRYPGGSSRIEKQNLAYPSKTDLLLGEWSFTLDRGTHIKDTHWVVFNDHYRSADGVTYAAGLLDGQAATVALGTYADNAYLVIFGDPSGYDYVAIYREEMSGDDSLVGHGARYLSGASMPPQLSQIAIGFRMSNAFQVAAPPQHAQNSRSAQSVEAGQVDLEVLAAKLEAARRAQSWTEMTH